MTPRRSEAGAALFAALAMVMLLAGIATLGLQRLRAATDRAVDAQARAEAGLLASAGATLGQALSSQQRPGPGGRKGPPQEPVTVQMEQGVIALTFSDAGTCFNLNSLVSASPGTPPQGSRQEFSRLLAATGLSRFEADALAEATAANLSARNILLADTSEWFAVRGVTPDIYAAAEPVLCALPSREAAAFNINSITPEKLPLLIAIGVSPDEARRVLASKPRSGWSSPADFWSLASPAGIPQSRAASTAGATSRWLRLTIIAQTPRTSVGRELLLDTLETPARIASSLWLAVPQPQDNAA